MAYRVKGVISKLRPERSRALVKLKDQPSPKAHGFFQLRVSNQAFGQQYATLLSAAINRQEVTLRMSGDEGVDDDIHYVELVWKT